MGVDPATFRLNLVLILGAIVLLVLLSAGAYIAITLIRVGIWSRKHRLAEQKWFRASRRADGRRYPGRIAGVCESCHKGGNHQFLEYGKVLCPRCYEKHWRQVDNWRGADENVGVQVSSRSM